MVFLQTKLPSSRSASSSLLPSSSTSRKKVLVLALGVSSSLNAFAQAFPVSPLPTKTTRTTSLSISTYEQEEKKKHKMGPPPNANVVQGVSASPQPSQCMREAQRPLIRVLEHGLPDALQTHEMIYDAASCSVLTTQMEEGRLVRLKLDPTTSVLSSTVKSTLLQMNNQAKTNNNDNSETDEEPFVGLHGLCASQMFPGRVWVTLQYVNRVCLVDIETLQVQAVVECPRDLPDGNTVGGPHCITEANGRLYACMKGGASCHGTDTSREHAEEATAHGVYRVKLDSATGLAVEGSGTLFRVPPTPVMCVVDKNDNCWVATDSDGSITMIPSDGKCSSCTVNVKLPFQYAIYHQTGPGIQIGPDGNVWFCILHGEGIVGKVDIDTYKVTVFELLTSSWNPHPRICHISWDKNKILYAISSDLLDKTAVNSLIRIKFDKNYEQVIAQHELALPSQASCIHRIAHVEDSGVAEPSVLVTELTKSQLLQVFKSTLPPLSSFPTKTMQMEVRRVYDAYAPCPRTGNPVCLCEFNQDSIALPVEAQFEGQEVALDPDDLKQVGAEPYVHPRTGEPRMLVTDTNAWPGGMWVDYPKALFDESEHKTDLYGGINGGTSKMQASGKGDNIGKRGVLKYYPEKLKELLQREPGRIPLMAKEMQAAGLKIEDVVVKPPEPCGCETANEDDNKES